MTKKLINQPVQDSRTASAAAAVKQCDHKFVDSTSCLKCGWTPPNKGPTK